MLKQPHNLKGKPRTYTNAKQQLKDDKANSSICTHNDCSRKYNIHSYYAELSTGNKILYISNQQKAKH